MITADDDPGREPSDTGFGLAGGAVVAAVAVVLLVLLLGGVGLLRGQGAGGDSRPTAAEHSEPDDAPLALTGSPATYDAVVDVEPVGSSLQPPSTVGRLSAGDVVEVRAAGFVPGTAGAVAQCRDLRARLCANVVRLTTDGRGRARVPYPLGEPTDGDVLVVEVDLERGGAGIVFGRRAPEPPTVTVERGLASIEGAAPGETLRVVRCRVGAPDPSGCDDVARVRTSPTGSASATLASRGSDDLVVLLDASGAVLSRPVQLAGRPGPRVDLDPSRLMAGFGLAALLLGLAAVLVRTTDWRVPAEAATPWLDAATFDA